MKRFYGIASLVVFLAALSTYVDYMDFIAIPIAGSYVPFDLFNMFITLAMVMISAYPFGYFYQKRIKKNALSYFVFAFMAPDENDINDVKDDEALKKGTVYSLTIITLLIALVSLVGIIIGMIFIVVSLPLRVSELSEIHKLLDTMVVLFLCAGPYVFWASGRVKAFKEGDEGFLILDKSSVEETDIIAKNK